MTSLLRSSALAAALVAGVGSTAHAVPFTQGSLVISATTDTTTDLSTTTAFNLHPAQFVLSLGTGDFSGLPTVTQADTGFDLSNLSSFNFTDGALGSFAATGVSNLSFNGATHALSFLVLGDYTTGTDFDAATLTADEAFSLTQIGGPDTAISISATFFSPEVLPPSTPEPMTLSLFGGGLAALGLMRRRRK